MCCSHRCTPLVPPTIGEQFADELFIANIALYKDMSLIFRKRRKIRQVTGVRELIQIQNRFVVASQPVVNKITSDKAGATSDEDHKNELSVRAR